MGDKVEKTAYGQTYVHQADGSKVIPGSKRPDGTFRPDVRVKGTYVPPEETGAFKTKVVSEMQEKQKLRDAGYVPGMAPPEPGRIPGMPPQDDGFQTQKSKKKKPKKPQEDVAEEKEAKAEAAPKEEVAKPVPKEEPKKEVKKEEPKKAEAKKEEPKKEEKKAEPKKEEKKAEPKKEEKEAEEGGEVTTEKLLRKAKKKLGEIEALIAKKAGQEMSEEEQKKVSKKAEFEAEIKYLEKVQTGKAVAPPPPKAKAAAKTAAKAEKVETKEAAGMALSPKTSADVEAAQKRLRNVQKKLREIEGLEEKKKGGTALSAEQEDKLTRKVEFEIELKHLSTIR